MSRSPIKREIVEEAAICLFATKGLTRTTIKDIAAAAGVTEGVLYRHYEGKEEMAWKLFNRELDQFVHLVSEVLFDDRLPFAQRFGLAIQTIYDYYAYNSDQIICLLVRANASSTVMPIIISVATEELAIALPQPKVLNLQSVIISFSSTLIVIFIISPQIGRAHV